MGCGSSKVKPERTNSQVTIESQQRTLAAYRRQRIARDMEQIASLRAEAEVEKALMLKRSSIDDRRPSYVLRVLEDLAEVEEGQEEVEDTYNNPVINGTYYNGKLVEQEQNRIERNIALQTPVTQHQSATPESKESEDDSTLNATTHVQNDDKLVKQEQNRNERNIALHTPVTQQHSVTPESKESEDDSSLNATAHAQNEEKHIEEQNTKRGELFEGSGTEGQKSDSAFDVTAHAQENTEKMDYNLTNHEREKWGTPAFESNIDLVKNPMQGEEMFQDTENTPAENQEKQKYISLEKQTGLERNNRLENGELERNGVQESSNKPRDSDCILPSTIINEHVMNATQAGFDEQNEQINEDFQEVLTQSLDS